VSTISLHRIAKRYGSRTVLGDVSVRFERGSTTALVGPSGCGKSTLLRILLGLVMPDEGRVLVDEAPVTEGERLAWLRSTGYVVQDGGLFPHLTAASNVTLVARHIGMPGEAMARRIDELATLMRLDRELLQRYPHELSGGQRQRVSLMRALMLDPRLLLLDEPLGALDPITRRGLQEELRGLFERLQKTVVLVTHDMSEAARLADRLVLLRDGRIVQEGGIETLLSAPAEPYVLEFIRAQESAWAVAAGADMERPS
jgi:osmoprotectant transport system ATP-binding protein